MKHYIILNKNLLINQRSVEDSTQANLRTNVIGWIIYNPIMLAQKICLLLLLIRNDSFEWTQSWFCTYLHLQHQTQKFMLRFQIHLNWAHFLFPSKFLSITESKYFKKFAENFIIGKQSFDIKVHVFWEGHKILRNLHITFDWHYIGQK